jgi:hypothetical protein
MPNDEDFPTADPYLTTSPDMPVRRGGRAQRTRHLCAPTRRSRCALCVQTLRNVVEDFLVNKTIFFVGDSINGLVYQAAVRVRREGVYARFVRVRCGAD